MVSFDNFMILHSSGLLMQENHYYPYGMLIEGLSNAGTGLPKNMYRYTDKEAQNDLNQNLLDFGWRQYDPVIARWHVTDPAEQFFNPYLAIGANPVSMIDPDGRKAGFSTRGGGGFGAENITPKSYDPAQSSVFGNWRHGGGGGGANAQHFASFGTTPGMYGVNGMSTTTSPGHWSGNVSNDISSQMQNAGWSNNQMALMDFQNGYWKKESGSYLGEWKDNKTKTDGPYEGAQYGGYQEIIDYEIETWVSTGADWNASGNNWNNSWNDIMAGTLLLSASTIKLPPVSLAILAVGSIAATAAYIQYNVGAGNEGYPGPWTYTYKPPHQDPIHNPPNSSHDKYPNWNWNKLIGTGITGLGAAEVYYRYRNHLERNLGNNLTPRDNTNVYYFVPGRP